MTYKERYSPKIKFVPYLSLPVENYEEISEGFLYSSEEKEIHGNYLHKGIDYKCEYGEPVYATADGYAVAGYHRFPVLNKDGTIRLFNGEPLSNGMGYFVQIYHDEEVCGVKGGRITQYGHLSGFGFSINPKIMKPQNIDIPELIRGFFGRKTKDEGKFNVGRIVDENMRIVGKYPWVGERWGYNFGKKISERESYLYSWDDVVDGDRYVVKVKKGDVIGYVGTSAVFSGEISYQEGKIDDKVEKFGSWDEVHLHFEEATRNQETLVKEFQRDPYDIYKSAKWYTPQNIKRTLFSA